MFPCALISEKESSIFQQTVNNVVSSLMRLTFYDNLLIGDFTFACLVPWPLNRSEAGGDLVLLLTSP